MDLASSCEINDAVGQRLPRGPDLPHRPLPGQGDGAEPARAALRQHHVRAAVERAAHRPRADHRGRDGRPREGAPTSTTGPARCATWCRTTCCSCSRWWRWNRRRTSRPTRCATRRSRCCARCGRSAAGESVTGQYRGGAVQGQIGRRLRRGAGPRQRDRDVRRAQGPCRQLALEGRAVLLAHRQAAARAGDRDRRPVPPGAALDLRRARGPSPTAC